MHAPVYLQVPRVELTMSLSERIESLETVIFHENCILANSK